MKYTLILLSLFITSCFGQSPKLIPLPEYTPVIEKENIGEYVKFSPYLDILFVIDDSLSMDIHQDNLSENIDRFIDELSRFNILKWQVGVTTSSIGWYDNYPNGAVVGEPSIINSQVINYRAALRKNLLVGLKGSGTEIFLETVYKAITSPNIDVDGPNADMFREGAFLAIFFITDADDQGSLSPKYVYDELLKFKGNDPDLMTAYSVVIPANDSRCSRSGEPIPHKIEEFTSLMKGLTFSLCDPDFGHNLARIGEDLLRRMAFVIQLKQVPVVSTIKVTYGSQVIPHDPSAGWSYSAKRNAILLGQNLVLEKEPKGTQIQVTFTPAILEP